MSRYAIIVQEYGANREVELCRVASDPAKFVAGLREMRRKAKVPWSKTPRSVPKYHTVYYVDREA